ncbi:hypothetical protein [Aromatoleum anaerobium]|uniref:Uncharacterized protein n=1 Tax=Aromatoleum anaerobium TaxID=182180 RepID=A0ABX1PPB9_9RHOO|nr:hypothetical protein [Aromatoleum anaerobium]MCK0508442.1 hypothetical protein [Aromatoleum anaerobium]
MSTKICACCGQTFQPDPRVKNHTFCSAPDCQKERCKKWRQMIVSDNANIPIDIGLVGFLPLARFAYACQ